MNTQQTMTAAEYRQMLADRTPTKKTRTRFGHIQQGWYIVAGTWYYFRSRAEYRFALVLQYWTESESETGGWLYEPYEFDFPQEHHGVTRYTPDFIRLGKNMAPIIGYEVKGKFNPGDLKKLKLMRQYYPGFDISPITRSWWDSIGNQYKFLDGWNAKPISKPELPDSAVFRPKTVPMSPRRFVRVCKSK